MSLPPSAKVLFGGDYNPEQWPEEIWIRDYELFDAARIDTVTLGVFDWALTNVIMRVSRWSWWLVPKRGAGSVR